MKQEIEQAVDQITEQEPSLDQLDTGEPHEFSGELLYGSESNVRDEVIEFLARPHSDLKIVYFFQLNDFDSRYADDELAIWVGETGADIPTGEDIVVELERRALANAEIQGE